MASWTLDAFGSGWPWLETSGTLSPVVCITDPANAERDEATGSTLSYSLYPPDSATALLTGTLTRTAGPYGRNVFTAAIAMGSVSLDPRKIYREVITGSVADLAGTPVTSPVLIQRDAYATPYPQRTPPIGSGSLVITNADLATAPGVSLSWYPQLALAWFEVCRWVAGQGRGALWTPSSLVIATHHLALHYVYTAKSRHGSAAARQSAIDERTAYANELEWVRAAWDGDGNGTQDTQAATPDAPSNIGGGG